jgi:hypothetical protein
LSKRKTGAEKAESKKFNGMFQCSVPLLTRTVEKAPGLLRRSKMT